MSMWKSLESAAKAATPGPWIAGDDDDSNYLLVGPHDGDHIVYQPVVSLHNEANAYYIAAANPAAILKLLEINAELVEALKLCFDHCRLYNTNAETNNVGKVVRAALAKAE